MMNVNQQPKRQSYWCVSRMKAGRVGRSACRETRGRFCNWNIQYNDKDSKHSIHQECQVKDRFSGHPNRGHQTSELGCWDTESPIWPFWSFPSPTNERYSGPSLSPGCLTSTQAHQFRRPTMIDIRQFLEKVTLGPIRGNHTYWSSHQYAHDTSWLLVSQGKDHRSWIPFNSLFLVIIQVTIFRFSVL